MAYSPTTWVEGVTTLGPTNMNHLELGLQTAAATAEAAIAKPASPSSNDALVWNGSTWVNSKLVDANISASAAIAYSKLSLAGSVVNNDISGSAGIAISKLADPTSGKVVGSSGSAAAAVFPPGYEILTTSLTTDTTTASLSNVDLVTLTAGTTFENVKYYVEIFVPLLRQTAAGNQVFFDLVVDTVVTGNSIQFDSPGAANGSPCFYRVAWTPSAASHAVKIQWRVSAGTATARLTSLAPALFRIVKA